MPEFKFFLMESVPKCQICFSPLLNWRIYLTYLYVPTSSTSSLTLHPFPTIWNPASDKHWPTTVGKPLFFPFSSTMKTKPFNTEIFKGLWLGEVGREVPARELRGLSSLPGPAQLSVRLIVTISSLTLSTLPHCYFSAPLNAAFSRCSELLLAFKDY